MNSKKRKMLGSVGVIALLVAVAFTGWLVMPSGNSNDGMGVLHVSAGDADPGAGASGLLEVLIVNHTNHPSYSSNVTSADSAVYGWGNADGFSVEIPWGETFDIVVQARGNDSYTSLDYANMRVNITSSDLGISTDAAMSEYEVASNSNYIWGQYVIDNGGSGYTISRDETASISSIKLQCYY